MKTAFVISTVALIALGAAVFSPIKANAEDAFSGGVPRYIRPYPVQPSAAPQEGAYYHRHSYHRLYYRRHHYHRRYY